jgi:hypothetical protein
MAHLGATFDPNEIPDDERGSFEPLPPGDYLLQVADSELKDKPNGDCGLNLTLEVVEGEFQGRKLWDYLNIRHSSADAQRIAQRRLADYCLATGAGTIRDSEELHFRPFIGKVSREPRKDTGELSNRIKGVRSKSGSPPAGKPAPQQQTGAPPPRQATTGERPWNRRSA